VDITPVRWKARQPVCWIPVTHLHICRTALEGELLSNISADEWFMLWVLAAASFSRPRCSQIHAAEHLIGRLRGDEPLRRICGWRSWCAVPHDRSSRVLSRSSPPASCPATALGCGSGDAPGPLSETYCAGCHRHCWLEAGRNSIHDLNPFWWGEKRQHPESRCGCGVAIVGPGNPSHFVPSAGNGTIFKITSKTTSFQSYNLKPRAFRLSSANGHAPHAHARSTGFDLAHVQSIG
jgi:hypothetical protein